MQTRPQRPTLPANPINTTGDAAPTAKVAPEPAQFARARPWEVIEIEGEASLVADGEVECSAEEAVRPSIPDQPDEVIVARLETRRVSVTPGESVSVRLALLNHGRRHACFQIQVEGWIDEQWIHFAPSEATGTTSDGASTRCWLHPGEHAVVTLVLAPPRTSASTAGERPIAFVVRAAEYENRLCRLGLQLTVLPYTDLALGELRPPLLAVSWRGRAPQVYLPVTNHSNQEVKLFVQAHAADRACQVTLRTPEIADWQPSRIALTLAPGQSTCVATRITPPPSPIFALRPRRMQIRLAAGIVKGEHSPLAANATLVTRPLVGPWPLMVVCLLMAVALGGALLVATLVASVAGRTLVPVAAPLRAPPATQPQIVTIIVNLAQPAATSPSAGAPIQSNIAPVVANIGDAPPLQAVDASAPIVRPEQVTAPGAPMNTNSFRPGAPFADSPRSGVSAPGAPPSTLTYQEMFQEIAIRYDLSWRVLAAQAYLESGFDALALGNSGDMGLMQIIPSTWREWAPIVDANDPFDAYSNTLVAAVYLDYLRTKLSERGQSQIEWMLVAYNWGIDKLGDHLAAGGSWEDLPAERRQYATDILRIAETIPGE
jgi:membrane-bound lytic murein transglycosylase F